MDERRGTVVLSIFMALCCCCCACRYLFFLPHFFSCPSHSIFILSFSSFLFFPLLSKHYIIRMRFHQLDHDHNSSTNNIDQLPWPDK
ncbi:hypothetical protein K457DRAFT_235819 [Linnemannia elongata AG-77]|uniref:Uncharacterized protein n=1 Tax=Linnemannia elongata AG-77 TaxID=1314771 RepID=A0A197JDY6_9FUNG|nr:hypothetical protein K457DRAFT_235819 [Linnemannia elongata AG-77]